MKWQWPDHAVKIVGWDPWDQGLADLSHGTASQYFTLPHTSLPWNPGRLHEVHVDSTWIPGKMSQKGNFHSGMHGILVECMLIPGSFLVESRKMFSMIICMDSMDSRQNYPKDKVCTWNPGGLHGIHGFHAKLSIRKNPKNIVTMSAWELWYYVMPKWSQWHIFLLSTINDH